MALTTNPTAILFATLSHSEADGVPSVSNWLRTQKFTQALSLISDAIFNNRGVVTKRFDDGILGTFADINQALLALIDIDRKIDSHEDRTEIEMPLTIALNYTRLHVIAGNVAGEGLDATVHLAMTADPGEIRVSGEVYEALQNTPQSADLSFVEITPETGLLSTAYSVTINSPDENPADEAPPLEDQELPTEPVPTLSVDTANTPTGKPIPEPPPTAEGNAGRDLQVWLQIGEQRYKLDKQHQSFSVGRGRENNAQISGTHVSREHGHFEFRDNGIYFVDHSSNGSCLLGDTTDHPVHRNEIPLELPVKVCLAPDRSKAPEELILVTRE